MSAEAALAVRTWKAGPYTCTLSSPVPRKGEQRSAAIEWAPVMPKRLTPDELRQYRAGRDRALAELSAASGINFVVLEV